MSTSTHFGLDALADHVTAEMFGAEDEYDLSIPGGRFTESLPLEVQATILMFHGMAKGAVPSLSSWKVLGGEDESGNRYAKVQIEAVDPLGVLQKVAGYAVSAAAKHGVSVTMDPGERGSLSLVFSIGASPDPEEDDVELIDELPVPSPQRRPRAPVPAAPPASAPSGNAVVYPWER